MDDSSNSAQLRIPTCRLKFPKAQVHCFITFLFYVNITFTVNPFFILLRCLSLLLWPLWCLFYLLFLRIINIIINNKNRDGTITGSGGEIRRSKECQCWKISGIPRKKCLGTLRKLLYVEINFTIVNILTELL